MRVAADFKDAAGKPHVADAAAMHTAVILEKLKSNDEAMQTYQSLMQDFPGSPRGGQGPGSG